MQTKINKNNTGNSVNNDTYAASTIVKSLLTLLFLSFSLLLNNNAMARDVVFLENKTNSNKKNDSHTPYNAFNIGYKFNHFKSTGDVYDENGHGFSISYDRDFVHTRYFSFGMGFGYEYSKYKAANPFTYTEDDGQFIYKETITESITLHDIDINFNFIFNLVKKLKLIAQIGFGADLYMGKGDSDFQVYDSTGSNLISRSIESEDSMSLAFSVNTNVGFDYDITKHFGIRALFKSSYCSTLKGIGTNLGALVAARLIF